MAKKKSLVIETVFKGVDKMSASIKDIAGSMSKAQSSTARSFQQINRGVQGLNKSVQGTVRTMAGLGAAAGAALFPVAQKGMDFEQTMVSAMAKFPDVADKSSDAFLRMNRAALEVGKTTKFSASDAAGGMEFLAMAGFTAEQSIASLAGMADVATATNVSLATAADITSDALGAMGLMTDDADQLQANLTRTTNALALATARANTDLPTLFEALKAGGPVAASAGGDIETVAAMIGVLANAGIKGSEAGTALKNIYLAVSAPTSSAAKAMKELGVMTTDAGGNVRDMVDVMEDLSSTLQEKPNSQQMEAYNMIFGKIPIASALNISKNIDGLRDLRGEMNETTDASGDMAKVMGDTTKNSLELLKSAVEGVTISIFTGQGGAIRDVIDLTRGWVEANGEFVAQNIAYVIRDIAENITELVNAGLTLAKISVVAWGVAKAFAAIAGAVKLYGIATAFAATATGALVMPIMGVVAAVAAIGGAIYAVTQHMDTLVSMWNGIKTLGSGFMKFMGMTVGGDTDPAADDEAGAGAAGVVPPAERAATITTNNTTTNRLEIEAKGVEASWLGPASDLVTLKTGGLGL